MFVVLIIVSVNIIMVYVPVTVTVSHALSTVSRQPGKPVDGALSISGICATFTEFIPIQAVSNKMLGIKESN
jgi:hypothetical protein